jgi:hypothetical protein
MPARLFEGKNKESEESWKFSYTGGVASDGSVPESKPHLVIPLAREKSVNTGSIIHDEVEWEKQRDQRAIDYKRNARQLIEQCRWVAMNKAFQKEQQLVAVKAAKSRITRHSVDYNPITLQYLENDQGKQLESLDHERKVPLLVLMLFIHVCF